MLSRLWWYVRAHVETFRQYRTAVVTSEALIWHHGYKGLDAALKAAEAPTGQSGRTCGPNWWRSSRPTDTSASSTPTLLSGRQCSSSGAGAGVR